MDCLSEEQLIRMKLDGLQNIQSLHFDIPNRQLTVVHDDGNQQIFQLLNSLMLDTSIVSSVSTTVDTYSTSDNSANERKLLWQVLGINFFFFSLEMLAGFIANSMGLIADSLDMLADSFIYGLAIVAIDGTVLRKKQIAKVSGYFQLLLAVLGFAEVIRRFLGKSDIPTFQTMIIVSFLALIGNAICLYLLQTSKSKEAHMQASMIFTSNDVIVNIGIIAAGGLTYATHSKFPDLGIGTIVFVIVGRGAFKILQLSK